MRLAAVFCFPAAPSIWNLCNADARVVVCTYEMYRYTDHLASSSSPDTDNLLTHEPRVRHSAILYGGICTIRLPKSLKRWALAAFCRFFFSCLCFSSFFLAYIHTLPHAGSHTWLFVTLYIVRCLMFGRWWNSAVGISYIKEHLEIHVNTFMYLESACTCTVHPLYITRTWAAFC